MTAQTAVRSGPGVADTLPSAPLAAAGGPAGRLPTPAELRPCAVVTSGTSRFLVLGSGGPATAADQEALVRALMQGRGDSPGLGDQHYQANKVVLVDESSTRRSLAFRFYQVSVESGRVYSDMECSNAAPAAALWAELQGRGAEPGPDGFLPTTNLSTGQSIALEPPAASPWWRGDWGVRFDDLEELGAAIAEDAEEFTLDDGGRAVQGHIVRHGNVFVLAQLAPEEATAPLVVRLAALGTEFRRRRDLPPGISKVLPYRPSGVVSDVLSCDAACFSSGQQHHSLPGSAAMAMAACLTAWRVAPVADGEDGRGRATVQLSHPSGTMTVRVHLARAEDPTSVTATSFATPVSLLLSGAAAI